MNKNGAIVSHCMTPVFISKNGISQSGDLIRW